jgi:hypothetical protein
MKRPDIQLCVARVEPGQPSGTAVRPGSGDYELIKQVYPEIVKV